MKTLSFLRIGDEVVVNVNCLQYVRFSGKAVVYRPMSECEQSVVFKDEQAARAEFERVRSVLSTD